MRVLQTEIKTLEFNCAHVEIIKHPDLACNFHARPQYHSHPEAQLLLILEGRGEKVIEGYSSPFETGDMVFLGPNVAHGWFVEAKSAKDKMNNSSLLLYINPHDFDNLFRHLKEFSEIHNLICGNVAARNYVGVTRESTTKKLMALVRQDGFQQLMGIFQVLHDLATSREFETLINNRDCAKYDLVKDPMVDVIRFVEQHLDADISVGLVASIAGMQKNAFMKFFRGCKKQTFMEYLQKRRMEKAKEYFQTSHLSVSEISEMCGYRSISRFCELFRLTYGQTPLQFRRQRTC